MVTSTSYPTILHFFTRGSEWQLCLTNVTNFFYYGVYYDATLTNYLWQFSLVDRDIKLEKSIGEKIKELREALGWSQEYLADVAGTGKKQIQRTEAGEYSPRFKTLTGIAKALGRQPWEICKVDYQVKVNTDLRPGTRKSPGPASFVHRLVESNFLDSPRAVKDVVQEVEVRYEVSFKSSAVSGVLKNLVEQKALKRLNAEIKGRFVYQKPKRKK